MFLALAFVLGVALSAATTYTYPANDENLYFSPFVWNVNGTTATTVNSAAYVRFLTSATQLSFQFDVSNMASPDSKVYWRVDNGPPTVAEVEASVSVTIPPNMTKIPWHSVELFVKGTSQKANRWSAGPSVRIVLTGIETDGQLGPWVPQDSNLLIYGDSITEAVATTPGGSSGDDTDSIDASMGYSFNLARLLGTEIGVVGFGGSGVTTGGGGGVPALPITWNQLWDGVPRDFSAPKPDLIVLNEGTNDGCDVTTPGCVGTDLTEPMITVLKSLVAACPGVPIAVLEPFNGGQIGHLSAAVAGAGSPDVHFVRTTGFFNMSYGGGLHPTGPNDVAQIAPKIANSLRPLLAQGVLARLNTELSLNK